MTRTALAAIANFATDCWLTWRYWRWKRRCRAPEIEEDESV